jgi:hypothetical protein
VSEAQTGRPASVTRWLLRCGLVAGPAFVIVFSVDGATRPGYRPLRHPVSSLSLGPRGWVQVTNFAVTGALYLAAAAGLARAADPATRARTDSGLVAVAAAGLIGAAAFRTDPVSGYPPGSPDVPVRPSRTGTAHNLLSAAVFLGVPAAAFADGWRALRRGRVGWGLYSAGTAMSMLAAMGAAGAGFGQAPRLVNLAGLLQRVSIVTGFGWLTARSEQALRPRLPHGDGVAGAIRNPR